MEDLCPSSESESWLSSQLIRPLALSGHLDVLINPCSHTYPYPTPSKHQLLSKPMSAHFPFFLNLGARSQEIRNSWNRTGLHLCCLLGLSWCPDFAPLSSLSWIYLAARSAGSTLPRLQDQFWLQAGRIQAAAAQQCWFAVVTLTTRLLSLILWLILTSGQSDTYPCF